MPKTLTNEDNKDSNENRPEWRYNNFLKVVNATEHLQFEDIQKDLVNKYTQNILNDERLSKANKKVLGDYYLYLANVMQSVESRRSYLTYVKALAIDLKKELKEVTKTDLQTFFHGLEKRGLKETSIFNSKLYLRCFFKWLHNVKKDAKKDEMPDVISWMEFKKDKTIKTPDEVLNVEEIKKMAQVCSNPRDSAIILSLFETGARCGEFLRLKISDVSFDKYGAVINMSTGKHQHYKKFRKLRMIYSVPSLKRWIEVHPNRDNPDSSLWITLGSYLGRGLAKDGLKRIIKVTARMCDIPKKKAYPHSFRHARCYDLLSKGFTDKDLRIWFGWSENSNMPSIYSGAYGMKDTEFKILKQEGLLNGDEEEKKEQILKPQVCAKCGHENSATLKFCEKCYFALDLKTVVDEEEQKHGKDVKTVKLVEFLLKKITDLDPKAKEELKEFERKIS